MNKGAKRIAVGTMIAGIAGYVAGVLTAPKSGKETREDISQAATQSIAETERQLKRLHTELNELLGEAQIKSSEAKGKTKDGLQDVLNMADTSKNKVREIISAIHDGDVDDKDLDRALKEAGKAIKHIRKYLQK